MEVSRSRSAKRGPHFRLLRACILLGPLLIAIGCNNAFPVASQSPQSKEVEAEVPPSNLPPVTPDFVLPEIAWEQVQGARDWSLFAFNAVATKAPFLIQGAKDVESFCPLYYSLDRAQRAYFWTALIAAVAYYESGWNPTARLHESTMGTDPVTGRPVYSEGLLQLSYQDGLNHSFCNEFDWRNDRRMSPDDPQKSILNPSKNLSCGIQILNRQISKYGKIAIDDGAYWAVLKTSKKSNKIDAIRRQLADVKICR